MTVAAGLALYVTIIALNIRFRSETLRFLAAYPAISDTRSLEALKTVARRNMKAVLPFVAATLAAMGLTAQLIVYNRLIGFVTFLLANVMLVWSALALRQAENLARSLPCPDPSLAVAYSSVVKSWLSDPWPRF